MTWHLATNHITSPHVTSQPTTLLHLTLQPTTSKQATTSPPWNGWRLVHSNNSVWASQWLVTLCTFHRQILSLAYSLFSLKLLPPVCPALFVYVYDAMLVYVFWYICSCVSVYTYSNTPNHPFLHIQLLWWKTHFSLPSHGILRAQGSKLMDIPSLQMNFGVQWSEPRKNNSLTFHCTGCSNRDPSHCLLQSSIFLKWKNWQQRHNFQPVW